MAEATQATTTTAALAATVSTSTPPPAAALATSTLDPLAAKDATGKHQGTHHAAAARADAAIAKAMAGDKPAADVAKPSEDGKATDAAKGEGEGEGEKPAADADKTKAEAEAKAAEDKKKADEAAAAKDTRLSRAMAIVAERERAIAKKENAFKSQIETERQKLESDRQAFTAEKARDSEDLGFVRRVRETLQTRGKPAAAALFGFTMEELVEAKSHEVEPSAKIIAEQEARRIYQEAEAERAKAAKAAEESAAAEKKQKEEKEAAEDYAKGFDFVTRAMEIHNAELAKRPMLSRTNFNGEQLWNAAKFLEKQVGHKVSPIEVLDACEKELTDRYAPVFKPADPPPPPPAPAPAAAKPVEVEKPKEPTKQEAKKPAEQPRRRYEKRITPMDRAAAALRSRGIDR
jgi:hypothetical protein